MFTSIRTRSGAVSRARATPSSPDSASPTTSKPSVASTTSRAACRNGGWSSTIITRTLITSMVPPGGASVGDARMPVGRGGWHPSGRERQERLFEHQPEVEVGVVRDGGAGLLDPPERPAGRRGREAPEARLQRRVHVEVHEQIRGPARGL